MLNFFILPTASTQSKAGYSILPSRAILPYEKEKQTTTASTSKIHIINYQFPIEKHISRHCKDIACQAFKNQT